MSSSVATTYLVLTVSEEYPAREAILPTPLETAPAEYEAAPLKAPAEYVAAPPRAPVVA